MAKTLVDIDETALAGVQRLLGGVTKKQAVNVALNDRLAAERARKALHELLDTIVNQDVSMFDDPDAIRGLRGKHG
ncbi:MAG: type II toxin-antitoxin system VapB family antitoxin [Candidatus Nanopelagicales bacterium]|nr:type II toxin-antitoxin system VapB family antitoxin [Candidatus Nanopelagicales bacterium]MDZ4248536.1 type II toxin-antitoxin system VapB family antitoxin [Candidatus Nanopelagicales bacterium]